MTRMRSPDSQFPTAVRGIQGIFANWRWTQAAPLIAHEGWVGVGVLPLCGEVPPAPTTPVNKAFISVVPGCLHDPVLPSQPNLSDLPGQQSLLFPSEFLRSNRGQTGWRHSPAHSLSRANSGVGFVIRIPRQSYQFTSLVLDRRKHTDVLSVNCCDSLPVSPRIQETAFILSHTYRLLLVLSLHSYCIHHFGSATLMDGMVHNVHPYFGGIIFQLRVTFSVLFWFVFHSHLMFFRIYSAFMLSPKPWAHGSGTKPMLLPVTQIKAVLELTNQPTGAFWPFTGIPFQEEIIRNVSPTQAW